MDQNTHKYLIVVHLESSNFWLILFNRGFYNLGLMQNLFDPQTHFLIIIYNIESSILMVSVNNLYPHYYIKYFHPKARGDFP